MAKKYKNKKGATGKKYTTYSDRIQVTYGDGSTRTVRPGDASYNVTKKAMESDIGAKKWYKSGNSKTTAETAIVNKNTGKNVKDGRGLVMSGTANKTAQKDMRKWRKDNGQDSLTQARQVNAQVAAAQAKAAAQVPKAFSKKALSSGLEQGKTNLVQGTKQGVLALADSPLWKAAAKAEASKLLPYQNSKSPSLQRAVKFNNQIAGNYSLEQQRRNLAQQTLQKQQAIANKYGPLNSGERIVSDVVANMIPMLPSIGAGMLTGGAGALLGAGARGVQMANMAGSMLPMFNYARGLGEAQALNDGATLQQANKYGIATGALEAGTEMLVGGIPGSGVKGFLNPLQRAALNRVKSEGLRKGVDIGMDIAGEGLEEAIAEAADPYFQRGIYNPDAENASLKEIGYAAGMGMLSGGLMKGGAHLTGKAMGTVPNMGTVSEAISQTLRQAQQEKADTALFGQNLQQRIQQQEEIRRQNAQTAQNTPQQVQNQQTTDNTTIVPNVAQVQNSKADNFVPQEMAVNAPDVAAKPIDSDDIPLQSRTMENIKGKKVNAYMYDHPEVKPAMQQQAEILLQELNNSVKGGRVYGVDPETRNATALDSVKSLQASTITDMRNAGMTNAQIKDGLQRIITDNGKENAVNGKRAELFVHDSLQNGYTSLDGAIPANLDYVYRDMTQEQLQEEMQRLGDSFSAENTDEQNAALANKIQGIHALRIERLQKEFDALRVAVQNATSYEEQAQYVEQAKAIRAQMDALQEAQQDIAPQVEQPSEIDYSTLPDYDLSTLSKEVLDFYEQVGELGGKVHFNVRIVEGMENDKNAQWDGAGVIYLNGHKLTDEATIRTITAHEIYHAMKGTAEFGDLQDLAIKYLTRKEGKTREQLLEEKKASYAAHGITLNEDAAFDEITAAFMEEALTDSALVFRIGTERPNLWQRIKQWIGDMLAKVRKLPENDLTRMQEKTLLEAQQLYSEGLYSMQYRGQQQDAQPRQMFAGEKSQTADLDALARAKQMAASGADMESIRQETGWFRSKVTGGKWAYEIDDSKAEYRNSGDARLYANPKYRRKQELEHRDLYSLLGEAEPLSDAEQAELERLQEIFSAETAGDNLYDYLYHPELYRAYPELGYTKVAKEELNDGLSGYHSAAEGRIVIDPRFNADGIMLHETQHAVQHMEGFPRGATPEYWKTMAQSKEDYVNESMLRMRQRKVMKQIDELSESSGLEDYIDQLFDKEMNNEITSEQAEALEQEFIERNVPELKALKDELYNDIYVKLKEIGSRKPDADKLYYNTAGELMARDTASRQNYDADNRRKIAPVMGDENTVYAETGGNSYSINERAAERFANQVDKVLNGTYNSRDSIMLGRTPKALKYVGYPDLPVFMTATHVYTMANESGRYKNANYHGMGADLVKQLPVAIEKPLLIAESKTRDDSVVLLTELRDKRNQPVIAAVKFNGSAETGGIKVEANILASAYGKKNAAGLFNEDNILYINKKGYHELQSTAGLQLPGGVITNDTFNANVARFREKVKKSMQRKGKKDIRYSLSDMADQYGAIPAGENPMGTNRDIQVPKRTNDSNRVRRFTRNAMEAEQVADETVAGIQKELDSDVQSGMFTYEPTSNKADLAEANKRIAANGWEETGRQLHEAVLSGRRINSADMATLERLIQEAQKAGQYDKAVDFVSDLAVIGTESGQNIQAIRMLKRLTPEGQLITLKNAQRRINNSLISKGQPAVPEISGEVAQEFLQARGNKMRGEIWDREIARMAQQTEGSWVDKLNAIRYAAMLSNPRTHIRNLLGNCAMQIARVPTNIISAVLEDTVSISQKRLKPNGIEQNRSLRNKTGQSSKELRKYAEMAWTADGEAAMRNVGNRYDDVSGQFAQNQRVFGHTKAGNVMEALAGNGKHSVGSVLDAEDMWFKHATYVNTLVAYMKANGITTRDATLNVVKPNGASIGKGMEYAGLQARKATFTEDNKLANHISKLENTNLGTQLALGAILPFKKTPMNIITRGIEYSPVGVLMTGYKLQDAARHQKTVKEYDELENRYSKKKVARESRYTVNDVLESLAANATGTILLKVGMELAAAGMLAATGDDEDKRKEQYDQQMGDQNFAVVLDDGSTYTIDWLAPAAMPLLTGVEVYNQLFSGKYDETDDTLVSRALSAAGKIADPVFEMSCMQGVASALASYSGDAGDIASTLAANIGTGYAGQFIPAPVGALARTIDDTVRSSYASKESPYTKTGENFLRQQRSKLPGLSKQNEASIDVWGNERKREFAGSDPSDITMRVISNFIGPGNYSSNKRTALDDKLTKLYEATGDSGVLPKRADTYIKRDGEPTVYLSPHEYSRFSTTKGKKSAQYAGDFTSSDAYKNLDDTTKADIVSKLYGLANYEAKKEALKGRGVDYADKAYENVLQSGVKPYEYYATKERFSGKWSNYDVVKEYAEHADKMGMKDSQYVAVYDLLGDLEADKDRNGKSISGSRKEKVLTYLNGERDKGNITKEQWWYFYTMEYPSQAKNAPYAWIREANK